MSTKRKRVDLDLSSKMDIIKLIDAKSKRKDIADKYGIDISTISKLTFLQCFYNNIILGCTRSSLEAYTTVHM